MKTRLISLSVLSIAALAAGHAMADTTHLRNGEVNLNPDAAPFVSQVSRATVQAATQQAMAAGLVTAGEAGDRVVSMVPSSTLTRANVRAEARAAQDSGKLGHGEAEMPVQPGRSARAVRHVALADMAPHGEAASAPEAQWHGERSRSDVRAEARQATRAGNNPHGEVEAGTNRFTPAADLTRAQVRQQAAAAAKGGVLSHGEM